MPPASHRNTAMSQDATGKVYWSPYTNNRIPKRFAGDIDLTYEDSYRLWQGEPLRNFKRQVTLRFTDIGARPDFPYTHPNVLVASSRVVDIMHALKANIETFRIEAREPGGEIATTQYYIVNLLEVVDCLDAKASRWSNDGMSVMRVAIDRGRIPAPCPIFRLKTMLTYMLISDGLKTMLEKVKATGWKYGDADEAKIFW